MPYSSRFDMSISAHDVAAELRRRFNGDPGVVKIHKLLYYAQGWHLTWVSMAKLQSPLVAMKGPHPSVCFQVVVGLVCPPFARASRMR